MAYGTRNDRWRQMANLIFAIVQIPAAYFTPLTGLGVTISARAGEVDALQPASYAFAIWGIIFLATIAYAIYQALPSQRTSPLLRRIGWHTAAAFFLLTGWSLVAQLFGGNWQLSLLLVVILAALLPAYVRAVRAHIPHTAARNYFVEFPLSILTGWVLVATVASTGSAFNDAGLLGTGLSVVLLLIAGFLAAAVLLRARGNLWFALTVSWGLTAVAVSNIARLANTTVAVVALAMVLLVLLAWFYTTLLARTQEYISLPA